MGSFGAHGIEEGAGNLYVHFQMRLIFERVAKFRWVPLGDLCVNTAVTKAQVWVKMNYSGGCEGLFVVNNLFSSVNILFHSKDTCVSGCDVVVKPVKIRHIWALRFRGEYYPTLFTCIFNSGSGPNMLQSVVKFRAVISQDGGVQKERKDRRKT